MARIIGDAPPRVRPAVHPPRPRIPLRRVIPMPPKPVIPGAPGPHGGPPAPPPGGGGGGGAPAGPPDYLALLKASPGYQSWLSSRNQRLKDLATGRAAAIRALILQFGGVPKGFQDAFGDLRPEDIAAAQGNQFGAMQEIAREDAATRDQNRRALAARGMLQSGDLGYAEGQQDLARGRGEYNALQNLLGGINEAIGNYTGGAGAIGAEESGIIAQLMPLIMQLYPYTPGAGGGGGGAGGGGGGAGGGIGATPGASPPKPPGFAGGGAVAPNFTGWKNGTYYRNGVPQGHAPD